MKSHYQRIIAGSCLSVLLQAILAQASYAEISGTDILNILVSEGILSEDKAKELVEKVRQREATVAKEQADPNRLNDSTVRVPYIPTYVREEIGTQVREEVLDTIADDVVKQAKADGWGIKEAPAWVYNTSISGDVRVRYQGDFYPSDNPSYAIFDITELNDAGGIADSRDAFENVNDDRHRLRGRARLKLISRPVDGVEIGVRLVSGDQGNPVSANQTLGKYGDKWETSFDLAYINYTNTAKSFELDAGRFNNPWLHSDLVWDDDMTFEGLSTTIAPLRKKSGMTTWDPFFSLGAFPLQEIHLAVLPGDSKEPPNDDKWLYAAQLGTNINFSKDSRFSFGLAYYLFDNIVGVDNPPNENNQDSTAAPFYQFGNSIQNIATDDPLGGTPRALYALASEFELLNLTLRYDYSGFEKHRLWLMADAVKNQAFDVEEVSARIGSGFAVPERDTGYQFEMGFGTKELNIWGDWKAGFAYRYLEGDAVVDAFADSDFFLGGTNGKGYILRGDWVLTNNVWLSLRWLSGEEIDATDVPDPSNPGSLISSDVEVDTFLLDLNAKF